MKKIKPALLLILIFFTFSSISYSEITENVENGDDLRYDRELLIQARDNFIAENGDLPVKQITIRGLTRTKESVILNESEISAGVKLSAFNPHQFINRLKKKNIFTDIHINYIKESESVIIELSLNEKWTIIPLPMFYSNGETMQYGLYILESNFLGYGKTVFAGGTYSEKSKSAIFGFMDPSILGSDFIANIFFIYKDSILQNGTMEKVIFSEYSSRQKIAHVDAGYAISKEIRLFLSGGYNEAAVDYTYSDSLNAPDSEKFYLSGAVFRFDFLKYYEYLYYGLKGEVKYYSHIPADEGKEYNTADYKIDYSHKLFNFHRITFFSAGSAGNKPSVLEDRISGKTGTRTLPADIISADNYINYSAVYEYPFLRLNWGAVTLLGLWEQGTYNKDHSPYVNYYGPGCGVLFYLKRVAFPAVGFNYARNLKTVNNEFSVNVGFTF
ncbi:MAG TPA: hypothetical protein PKG60_04970 [Spirochaetota bacterium]|nr:hypothetical protein [Spirochaetota bacterium]HPS86268.1 hypothetical protein [Spirochaetota bacterium]